MERYNPFSVPPGTGAVGDTPAEGTDPRPARADHRHGREIYGSPVAVTPDGAASAGTGTDVIRANHQHGLTTYTATPAAVAATGSAGTPGTAPVRGDHIHALGIGTTRGDIIVWGASGPVRLALGASGNILKSDGTDAVWAADPGVSFVTRSKWGTD